MLGICSFGEERSRKSEIERSFMLNKIVKHCPNIRHSDFFYIISIYPSVFPVFIT